MQHDIDPHRALAEALTVFEQAVRRHSAAETELRVARRASTAKAELKTAGELASARRDLALRLQALGWRAPADVDLVEPAPLTTLGG